MKDKLTGYFHNGFMNFVIFGIYGPVLFFHWLLFGKEFGAKKAFLFVVVTFLLGGAFLG